MIEPYKMTPERAQKLIEQMKLARPQCKECNYVPFEDCECNLHNYEVVLRDRANRSMEDWSRNAELFFVRRCDRCANELRWPFAPQLDAQRVADYINKAEGVFNLSELVHTLDNVVYGACTVSIG
jgi:hypothetical protein